MFRRHTGLTSLEYIIVIAIIVAVVGPAVLALAHSMQVRLDTYNTQIGS